MRWRRQCKEARRDKTRSEQHRGELTGDGLQRESGVGGVGDLDAGGIQHRAGRDDDEPCDGAGNYGTGGGVDALQDDIGLVS